MTDGSRRDPERVPTGLAELSAEVEALGRTVEELRTGLNETARALDLARNELATLQAGTGTPTPAAPRSAWRAWLSPSIVVGLLYLLGLLLGIAALASGYIKLN